MQDKEQVFSAERRRPQHWNVCGTNYSPTKQSSLHTNARSLFRVLAFSLFPLNRHGSDTATVQQMEMSVGINVHYNITENSRLEGSHFLGTPSQMLLLWDHGFVPPAKRSAMGLWIGAIL